MVKKDFDVQVIPAREPVFVDTVDAIPKKRVAAYCRVSTDEEQQQTSFELQVEYYTKLIADREDWMLAGIYADEGISGTQVKHREQFQQMIEDCRDHKIDMIITKSISRFARNVVDCLTTIRELKNLSPPVNIYFEKERIDSLDEKTEIYLTMLASFAQEESRSISTNIRWAIRNRMKEGTQKIVTSSLLGYDTDEDYNMVIIEQEAKIVRLIYETFLKGEHPAEIADRLNSLGFTTVLGNPWSTTSVKNILRNEKYCGNVIMQKTITIDYLTHKTKKNEGEQDQYFIEDHHVGIVSHEVWDAAQVRLDAIAGKRRKKKIKQQRLIPISHGLLKGFIPINRDWKTLSHTRLVTATEKLLATSPYEEPVVCNVCDEGSEVLNLSLLQGFDVVDLVKTKGESVLTLTSNAVKFNKATAVELNYPPFIRVLINAKDHRIAIQPCTEKNPNAIQFSNPEGEQTYAIFVKVPALLVEIRRLMSFEEDGEKISYSIKGNLYPDENVIIYDLEKATKTKQHKTGRKKVNDESDV